MRNYIGLIVIFLSVGLLSNLHSKENETLIPKLQVRGEAHLLKPAEKMLVHIGVVTQSVKPDEALDSNNEKMQKVIGVLKGLGLGSDSYKTGQIIVRPRYQEQSIIGYEATNTLALDTDRLDLAGDVLSAVNKAGINSIDSIQFTLKDPREYRVAAIQTATANAIADAQTLAQAAGVKLGRVLDLTVSDSDLPVPRFNMAVKTYGGGPSVPIESGDVEVNANVSITYEISGL